MKNATYDKLIKACGGTITPNTLKGVLADIEFQNSEVKQQFWQYMFEMGETFGDIQSFVVQDRQLIKESNHAV